MDKEENIPTQCQCGVWHKSLDLHDFRDILLIVAIGVAALLALKALLK